MTDSLYDEAWFKHRACDCGARSCFGNVHKAHSDCARWVAARALELISKVQAKALDEAAAILNQAADEANSECDNAHYESDTGAWVCTRRGGCDCEAIQDQADKHRKAILALKDRRHD